VVGLVVFGQVEDTVGRRETCRCESHVVPALFEVLPGERDGLDGSLQGARDALDDGVSRVDDELRIAHAGLQAIQDTLDNFGLVDNLLDAITAIAEGDAKQAVIEVLWAIGSLVGDVVSMVYNIVGAGYGVKTMLDVASIHEETLSGIANGRVRTS